MTLSDSGTLTRQSPAGIIPPKQARALETRKLLIASARKVFARDGFEQARVEDIARMSHKTRGAFYANFTDKEDVFFAIFEEDIEQDHARLRPSLLQSRTIKARIEVLADYLVLLCKDRQRTLLNLEFKAYAIRHPRRQKRLADLHAAMRVRRALPELDELFPKLRTQTAAQRRADSLVLSGMLDGLAVSRLFDPEGLDDEQMKQPLLLCLNQIFR